MEYLLVDSRQRFLGTLNRSETLSVGDLFQDHNDRTYAVVGTNWSNYRHNRLRSLTVVRINPQPKKDAV